MSSTLREIRLFVAAFEERSFTAAASRENATQSGVSQHIRKLEERFQVRLFTRGASGGGVAPSPAGEVYYRHCLEVLRAHDAANQGLKRFASTLDGEVTVGLMPTMTRSALAPTLARFVETYPNVSVSVSEGYSGSLTDRVRAGELSFAVVPAFPSGVGLKSRIFARTPEVLVSRGNSGGPPPESLSTMKALKLILPAPNNTRRQILDTYLASNNIRVNRILELDAMFGTLDLVSRSDWVVILPGMMMAQDGQAGAFRVQPITKPPLWLDLVLIEPARRALSPAEQAFVGILEEETNQANWTADRLEHCPVPSDGRARAIRKADRSTEKG